MDSSESTTVVLVHGAGAASWTWDPVVKELDTRGIDHIEVDLPTSDPSIKPDPSFHDDADHVRSVLEQLEGPVVLVGNSYGGVVITEASADNPNIVRLVYLAAFMPDGDEEVMNFLIASCTPAFMAGMTITADGRGGLDPQKAAAIAFQQATPEVAEWAVSKMQTMAMGQTNSPTVGRVGWRKIPSTYVVCGEDNAIQPEVQRQWAEKRATDYIEVPYDHCPQLSHPAEIADVLARIVMGQTA